MRPSYQYHGRTSEGWCPRNGQKDVNEMDIPDRIYTNSDYDYNIIIEDRIQQMA